MNQYAYFNFFDKQGKPLNFDYDSAADRWSGEVYFDRVSVNLFENEQVFILERVCTAVINNNVLFVNATAKYTYPILWNNPVTSPASANWHGVWTDDTAIDEIYLYTIANQRVIDKHGNVVDDPFINGATTISMAVDQSLETQQYILLKEWLAVPGNFVVSDGPIPAGIKILTRACGALSPGPDFNFDFNIDLFIGMDTSCTPLVGGDFNDDFNEDFDNTIDYSLQVDLWGNNQLDSRPLQYNILLTSTEEYIYQRTLLMQDLSFNTPWSFASILFWGETIGEDERLRLTLENFGQSFDQSDVVVTREGDISEDRPDWMLINQKRKQLLLTFTEISPFLGSYRGFVNAIAFFGYQDLRVKEYWLNIDSTSPNYGKYLQYQINGLLTGTSSTPLSNPLLATGTYQKTALFGMFYDITVANGEYDEWGTPITVDANVFTPEEVLVKLFALKQRLTRDYLPLDARIVDIVGEGLYFSRIGIRTWEDDTTIIPMDINQQLSFTAFPQIGYIRDIRRFLTQEFDTNIILPVDQLTNTVDPYTAGQQYTPAEVPSLIASIQEFYTQLNTFPFPYNGEKQWMMTDQPGALAGCPAIFTVNLDSFTWNDVRATWNAWQDLTWDTVDFLAFYEIEWIIDNVGGLPYHFSIRGKIADYQVLPHFLPYTGSYTVTVRLYDLYNSFSTGTQTMAVQVTDREVEVAALCRFRNAGPDSTPLSNDYTWDGVANETWDDLANSDWYFPTEGATTQNNPVLQGLTDYARYRNQEDYLILNTTTGLYELYLASTNPNRDKVGTRFLCWDGLENLTWDDMYHQTWNTMDYHGDFLGGFPIRTPVTGDFIQIDDWPGHTFGTITSLQDAADELNASTDPGIALFNYTVRFQPPAGITPVLIHASAKSPGASGWRFVNMVGTINGATHSFREPTWLNYSYDPFLLTYPSADSDMTFVDQVNFKDATTGANNNLAYWQNAGFIKTEPPSADFPLGERRGYLPCWNGTGMFTNDLRVYTGDFEVPLGVTLFFVCDHGEIPGKTNCHWQLINEETGELVIDVTGKNSLIYTFDEPSQYSVSLTLQDSNGNTASAYKKGFVNVRLRADLGKQVVAINQQNT